jgi:hypothetical protein
MQVAFGYDIHLTPYHQPLTALYQFYITEEHSVQIQAMPNNNKKDDVRT